jgi:DNA-binding transcriptional MerR regulator
VYEEAELIAPRALATRPGMYSEQDLLWLRCIRDMIHNEGLTVTAIAAC